MATYRAIATTETDPEAPLSSALIKALALNPTAMAEGASGAPKIVSNALISPTAGTTYVLARMLGASGIPSQTTRSEILRVQKSGEITFAFDYTNGTGTGTNSITLYRHGSTKTAMFTATVAGETGSASVDVEVLRGNMIYVEISSGSSTAGSVDNFIASSGVDGGFIA